MRDAYKYGLIVKGTITEVRTCDQKHEDEFGKGGHYMQLKRLTAGYDCCV
jgi:hypothetical protein